MPSILFGILEVAGHPNGKDARRALDALQDLRAATLNGHDVLAVIDTYNGAEPTHIEHYGYSYLCTDGCDHEDLSWGVERYFGINLVVSGDWDIATYPLRYWVNSHAQIVVVGKTGIHAGKRNALEEVQL